MHEVMRFWLRRGVDGFRVDAVWYLIKDDRSERLNPKSQDAQSVAIRSTLISKPSLLRNSKVELTSSPSRSANDDSRTRPDKLPSPRHPPIALSGGLPRDALIPLYTADLPEVHDAISGMRRFRRFRAYVC